MTKMDYLKLLVDEIHSTTVATIRFRWTSSDKNHRYDVL